MLRKITMVMNTLFTGMFAVMFMQSNFSEQILFGKIMIIVTIALACANVCQLLKPIYKGISRSMKQRRAKHFLTRQIMFLI